MFLRFTRVKRGSAVLEYASIAERVVEDNKQKTLTVKYLGSVKSDEDRERYRKILEEYREAMRKFSMNDMNVKPTLSFGIFYAARTIMERNGMSGILEKHTNSYAETLSFMIISRLFDPSSDINLIDIDKRVYYPRETHISDDSVTGSLIHSQKRRTL